MRKFVKPVETRPGIMYGNYKVHKQQVDGCPRFSANVIGFTDSYI